MGEGMPSLWQQRQVAGPWRSSNNMTKQADKQDDQKPMWQILMSTPVEEVVKVFTMGAKKYAAFNWRNGVGDKDYRFRLLAAACRHVYAYFSGRRLDEESGIHHLAHACADLLMVIDIDRLEDAGKEINT